MTVTHVSFPLNLLTARWRPVASVGMVSAEGERVSFYKSFKLRGPVEKWLTDVESAMTKTLQKLIKQKKAEVYGQPVKEWIFQNPAQVTACLAQLFWTLEVEDALEALNSTDPEKRKSLIRSLPSLEARFNVLCLKGIATMQASSTSGQLRNCALSGGQGQLESVYGQQLSELEQLTNLVRQTLTPLERAIVSALAIQALHNRDVVETLIGEEVTCPDG